MANFASKACNKVFKMENQHNARLNYINDLSRLIEDATTLVDGFLYGLGWTKEKILDDYKGLVNCPVDKSHNVQPSRLDEHIKDCQLKAAGFNNLSVKDLPVSSAFFYQSPSSSVAQVTLDKNQLESLGMKMKRKDTENGESQINKSRDGHGINNTDTDEGSAQILFQLPIEYLETMLSVEDRLKLYEYVLQKSKSEQKAHAITYDELEQEASEQLKVLEMQEKEDSDRPKSKVEAMAELRDYKRRRQSYRAKTISQSKRPAVEVIRELIDQQMKYLEIISGKRPKVDGEGDREGEQNAENLEGSVKGSGSVVEESVRDSVEEDLSQSYQSDRNVKERSRYRYEMKEVSEGRRQDRSRDRHYGRRESWNRGDNERDRERDRGHDRERYRERDRGRDMGHQWRRDGYRDVERNRYRSKERRSRSRERDRNRVRDDRIRDRNDDIDKRSYNKIGDGRDIEIQKTTDSQVIGLHQAGRNMEEVLVDRTPNECEGQSLSSKVSKSVGETQSVVEEKLKDIRAGILEDGTRSQEEDATYEDEDVIEELNENEHKRRDRKRARSSSESINGSRSGSVERHKNRKNKHKKKKKKNKRKKDKIDDENMDEWVEKNQT